MGELEKKLKDILINISPEMQDYYDRIRRLRNETLGQTLHLINATSQAEIDEITTNIWHLRAQAANTMWLVLLDKDIREDVRKRLVELLVSLAVMAV